MIKPGACHFSSLEVRFLCFGQVFVDESRSLHLGFALIRSPEGLNMAFEDVRGCWPRKRNFRSTRDLDGDHPGTWKLSRTKSARASHSELSALSCTFSNLANIAKCVVSLRRCGRRWILSSTNTTLIHIAQRSVDDMLHSKLSLKPRAVAILEAKTTYVACVSDSVLLAGTTSRSYDPAG